MKYARKDLVDGMDKHQIPEHMRPGLIRWIEDGVPPGHFLSCILKNDLYGAINRADDENILKIYHYVRFLYNYAPAGCWRSEKNYEEWTKKHGLLSEMSEMFNIEEHDGGE